MSTESEPKYFYTGQVRNRAFEIYLDSRIYGMDEEAILDSVRGVFEAYRKDPVVMKRDYVQRVGGDAEFYFAVLEYLILHFSQIAQAYASYVELKEAMLPFDFAAILDSIDSSDS
jgi:hypothetical protein